MKFIDPKKKKSILSFTCILSHFKYVTASGEKQTDS